MIQGRGTGGQCLDATERDKDGGKVHMSPCSHKQKNQQWSYDAKSGQIRAIHGKCLDAAERKKKGGEVHMWTCDTTWYQQWNLPGKVAIQQSELAKLMCHRCGKFPEEQCE